LGVGGMRETWKERRRERHKEIKIKKKKNHYDTLECAEEDYFLRKIVILAQNKHFYQFNDYSLQGKRKVLKSYL
jgi:hypothetical protein